MLTGQKGSCNSTNGTGSNHEDPYGFFHDN
jgi:hypothetical protein